MSESCYAVFIGINEYADNQNLPPLRFAEKDSVDMHHVLAQGGTSMFSPEKTKLLLNESATIRNIEEALYTYVVKDRTPDDTVLVYFSGHGFLAGDRGLAYLGTYDVQIKEILKNPNAGLRMNRVFEDYFLASPAKNVIFILDCCHSGALTPNSIKGTIDPETRGLIDRRLFSSSSGRVALVACPPDAVSRESADLQNGIFTYYILRGLMGEAAELNTGEVTLDSLLSFVRLHAPSEQPPGSYGQYYGRIVLSSPGINKQEQPRNKHHNFAPIDSLIPVTLPNPLDSFFPFVQELLSILSQEGSSNELIDKRILNTICKACNADYSFVLRSTSDDWFVKSSSDSEQTSDSFLQAISRTIAIISRTKKNHPHYENAYYPYEDKNINKCIIIVPLWCGKSEDYLVVYGSAKDVSLLGDVCPQVLQALYFATRELTQVQPLVIESEILDALKRSYGHVPLGLYNRRFDLFRERLQSIIIHFEPILHLEPNNLYISAWEALARDPVGLIAPTDLFAAAELWGKKFITELDVLIIQKALNSYREALKESKIQRPYEIQDISVNVYPETLIRTAYNYAVRDALRMSGLAAQKLFLEISEKSPIPNEVGTIEDFKRILTNDYIRGLKIGGFAIDDFGVGQSSVSRLARLEPEYIKVDRDVLQHDYTDTTLRFVLDLATQNRLRYPKVIVEGFDGSGAVSLSSLYKLGIRYVQGYQIGKAGAKLYRLEKEGALFLTSLLNIQEQ